LSIDYVRGRSPDHVAFVGAVSMGVTALLVLVRIKEFGFATTSLSLVQVLLPFGVGVGAAFMAWLARQWDARDLSKPLYPGAVAGLIVVAVGVVYVALPDLFSLVYNNVLRTIALSASDTTRTIAEAKALPLDNFDQFMRQQYGMLFYTAVIGLVWMATEYAMDRTKYTAEVLFVVVWAVFLVLMALTQVRFNYYLAAVVAVLNAWALKRVLEVTGIGSVTDTLSDVSGYQVLVLLSILIIVVAPLAPPLASTTVVSAGDNNAPGESVARWSQSGEWMQDNTPHPGTYENPDGERMEYYGTYEETDDFEYPDGAYGVMSWWDYGHWITIEGERIPVANPFQQNAPEASAFFLSQDEERARLLLEAMPTIDDREKDFHELSNDDLQALIDRQNSQQAAEDTRYVVIDDQMAGEKFAALTVWTDPSMQYGNYLDQRQLAFGQENETVFVRNEEYRDTMLSRLYHDDAQGLGHFRLVHEVDNYSYVGGLSSGGQVRALQALQLRGGWSQQFASISQQVRSATMQGQAAQLQPGLFVFGGEMESSVKTYEQVPGATIEGSVEDPNATVSVQVPLRLQNTNRSFTYSRSVEPNDDGSFSVTVPYATTDYLGTDEGYTNSSVRAEEEYTVRTVVDQSTTAVANVSVPERAVVTEEGDPIQASFDPVEGPTANITANATTITAGESIEFSSEESNNVQSVLWSGAVESRNRTVTETFSEPGNYTVELTVVDEYENQDTATLNVTVEADDGSPSVGSAEGPGTLLDGPATPTAVDSPRAAIETARP
ncbi:MAG: oligosaccharyl transferase, archaeosortase A system-associated, partial [Halodesulfurarchaeum sp.]